MIDKAYVEITNICNLHCDFCVGHKRPARYMSADEFKCVLDKLDGRVKYLYLHLMGEPLTHPQLAEILSLCDKYAFKVMLTTNGTLLTQRAGLLLSCKNLYKLSVSLHSAEGVSLENEALGHYLDGVLEFAKASSEAGKITVLRLWNENAPDHGGGFNSRVLGWLHRTFEDAWEPVRCGSKLRERLYLEYGARFKWPELEDTPDEADTDVDLKASEQFCFALRDQFGVLSDGTVVPCCLDHDGALALGNIFDDELDDILNSETARAIYDGFSKHKAVFAYCRSCRRPKPR